MNDIDSMFQEPTDVSSMFEEEAVAEKEAPNRSLNSTTASYTALLKGGTEDFSANHREIMAEYDMLGYSPTAESLEDQERADAYLADKQNLSDIITDVEMEDDIKLAAVQASLDLGNERYSLRNDYSTKILAEDSEYPNDQDNEFVRIKSAEIVDEVNYYNNQLLGFLSTEVAKSDPKIKAKVADFAQFFIPFMEQGIVNNIDQEDENWPFLLMGSAKADMAKILRRMPPERRLSAAKSYADIVNSNASLFSDDNNDLARVNMLSNAFDSHSYTSEDEMIDNFISVLEIGGLFSAPIKGVLSAASKLTRVAKARFIRAGKSPVSPIENATQFNQKKAKEMHSAILADETDDTAQALAGTTREQYLADAELPQIHDADGIVTANTVDPNLKRIVEKDGAIYWSDEAKSQARLKVSNDFIRASSADIRANMSSVSNADDGLTFHAVYGPAENGWKNPQEAIETMAYNLRDFGVDESSFKILGKQADGTYKPVTLEELDAMATIRTTIKQSKSKQSRSVRVATKEPADYLIQIDHKHKFNPLNITDPKNMEARFNLFDRSKTFMGNSFTGSISRNALDPMSLINKSVTQGASVAVDKSSAVERVVLDLAVDLFAKPFNKMKPEKQDQLYDIIKRQNKEQRNLTRQELIAEGLNGEEIRTLEGFKTVQDNLYYLENRDLAMTLRNQGNKILVDKLGTKLIGKERARLDVNMNKASVYDADAGAMLNKTDFNSVKHYDDGGTIVELRRPQKIGDQMVTHVVTKNKGSGTYTRAIGDNETVLNYRQGYYKVKYDAPIFITKQVLDDSGNVLYVKTIGTAQSTREAKMLVAKKQSSDNATWNNSGVEESIYRFRDDVKNDPSMNTEDMEFDLATGSGRSSQKYRGERLEDSNEAIDTTAQHIAGPVDAMVQAARGLSSRTTMRPYIDGVKSRFVDAYKTELKKDKFGKIQFPKNMDELNVMLKERGEDMTSLGADMRSNFEYINYLENGYRNALDEAWKGAFNVLAKWMGNKSPAAERAGYWMADNTAPTQLGKNLAFNMYLALNPLRQIIVQGHQSIQLAAIHPKYFATGLGTDFAKLTAMRMGTSAETAAKLDVIKGANPRTPQQVKTIHQEYMDSGIPSAIDKQSLVAGNLTEATEYAQYTKARSVVGSVGKGIAAGLRGARKIGFDVGEDTNMMTAWLTMRNAKAEKLGRFELTAKELEEVSAEARNFTFNMNAAGDMPYNQSFLSIPMQFLQVPHKAATQLLANNALTAQQKVQVAAYSMFMYAPAGTVLSQWLGDDFFEGVPDPVRDIIEDGAESAALNGLFSSLSGEDVEADWSSLAPYDAGILGFTTALLNTDLASFYTESPSGQLFAANGRVNNLARSVGSLINPYDKHETSQDFLNTVQAFLKLSSGYSNVAKAEYAIRTGQALSSRGDVIDSDVSKLEGMLIAAGFPTKDSSWKYKTVMLKADRMKSIKEDAKAFYDNIRTHLINQGVTNESKDFAHRAIAEGSMYDGEDRDVFLEQLQTLIKRDARASDFGVLRYIQKDAGIVTYEEQLQAIENMPNISDARRQILKDRVRILNNWKTEGIK
tara:strand:- start:3952 stop:8652 length:4701 start_codon:yes stop_codon:yes gene_type:complete